MQHTVHPEHAHEHGAQCSHIAIRHDDHLDYVHDGHLHHVHEGHIDEHSIAASSVNPVSCDATHACAAHDATHVHGRDCGHEQVPHADHADFLVDGHLHNAHGTHCDDHGVLLTA